jgi:alpha-mannosidase
MTVFDELENLQKNVKGYWGERIIAEINCAIKVSEGNDGKYSDIIKKAIDYLTNFFKENNAVTKAAAIDAEEILLPVSEAAKAYTMHCVAHAHIDMNWMWGFSETASVAIDTFRTMLDLMNEYPEFTFSQSQASTYKIVEEYDPALLEEIKSRVKEGRWEISASTWVEADKNMPNGESFARHVLYTKRYINKTFGVNMDDLSLDFEPDTFGHNWSIPEIMSKSGVKYYYHNRAYDGYYVYRWQSRSNAEVIVLRDPKGYNATVSSEHIPFSIQFCNDASIKDMLYLYGVGDHGGGPTRHDLEKLIDMMSWPIAPVIKFSTYGEFYSKLEAIRESLPIVNQELNFVFTGCYTSQSRIKMSNRISEDRLYVAEAIAAAATNFAGAKDYKSSFVTAWEKTLFNQFHDILTGSGIIDTREYALGEFQKTMAIANTSVKNAMRKIADAIDTSDIVVDKDNLTISEGAGVGYGMDYPSNYNFAQTERGRGKTRILHMFNPTEFNREGPANVVIWDWNYNVSRMSVRDTNGNNVKFEILEQGSGWGYWGHLQTVMLIDVNVPAFGYNTYIVTEESAESSTKYGYSTSTADTFTDFDKVMENDFVKAVFKSGDMRLISFIDKETGKDIMCKCTPSCGFRFIYEDTIPGMTAWRVGRYAKITDLNEDGKVIIYEQRKGELKQTIKYKIEFERSSLDVAVSLNKNSKMLKFDVTADWHEIGNGNYVPQLNFAVPFNFNASKYRYDIPFGTIDREPINGDTPGNSFIMAIPDCDCTKPLMLVTDTKYGFRGVNNSLAVDLIRSSIDPDPSPEDGIHRVRIGVGIIDSLCNKDVFKASSRFIHPISFISGTAHNGTLPKEAKMMTLEGDVKCSAVKTPEDGDGLIIRLYDANGKGGKVTISFPKAIKCAKLTDLTEVKNLGTVAIENDKLSFNLGAFEIGTVMVCF